MMHHSPEIMDARRRRRSAAGRSGGMFEVVKDGDSFNYRYAAPDSEPYRRESMLAWESIQSWKPLVENSSKVSTSSNEMSFANGHEAHLKRETDRSTQGANNDLPTISTKTAENPLLGSGPTETETKSTKSNRTSRAFKRINNRVSKFIHRKQFSDNEEAAVTIEGGTEGGTEGVLPSTPTNHARASKPDSPFKEQMSLEADHELPHEEVNKEFFTPPRIRGADTKIHDIADGEVFD
ncbi:hypothetical protein PV11_07566 [Exophiala sideris]|uniref:Uncharacterized protein n=1 Tax=Exophiala sideris TaxID=1016849 RepID=A0A0D1YZ54_9EURO|nr:hypothetical protein PV11_07566 [Exophiala sideris]